MAPEISHPPAVVGILNITPDSFSDGGLFFEPKAAIDQALRLQKEGADFVELGGESTRPGSSPISLEQEWSRVEPVLRAIGGKMQLAIDTYKGEIARRAIDLGATLINDVSALRADPDMARVIAQTGASVVLMHSKEDGSRPHATERPRPKGDLLDSTLSFLLERARYAERMGVRPERIILDPGLGKFISTDPEDSWSMLRNLSRLTSLSYPILLGASRKGFLGPRYADELSALVAVFATMRGISYLRTHNVEMTRRFLLTWNKLHDV